MKRFAKGGRIGQLAPNGETPSADREIIITGPMFAYPYRGNVVCRECGTIFIDDSPAKSHEAFARHICPGSREI